MGLWVDWTDFLIYPDYRKSRFRQFHPGFIWVCARVRADFLIYLNYAICSVRRVRLGNIWVCALLRRVVQADFLIYPNNSTSRFLRFFSAFMRV